MLLLLFALTGCFQYHIPETYPETLEASRISVSVSYQPGSNVELNGLRDFGSMIFEVEAPPDVSVSILRIVTTFSRRVVGSDASIPSFLPDHSRYFFERCGLFQPGALSPTLVAENPIGPMLAFFPPLNNEGLVGIAGRTSVELKILCALEDTHTPYAFDLAIDVPTLREAVAIEAMRDDGTMVPQTSIDYIVESTNDVDENPLWYQTMAPTAYTNTAPSP